MRKDLAGSTLIAREFDIDCMKWQIKITQNINFYIYTLREANVEIAVSLKKEERESILKQIDAPIFIGFDVGEVISGKCISMFR